jgi:hypothetical protein
MTKEMKAEAKKLECAINAYAAVAHSEYRVLINGGCKQEDARRISRERAEKRYQELLK